MRLTHVFSLHGVQQVLCVLQAMYKCLIFCVHCIDYLALFFFYLWIDLSKIFKKESTYKHIFRHKPRAISHKNSFC